VASHEGNQSQCVEETHVEDQIKGKSKKECQEKNE
jgi:hypothetical protein